MKIEKIGKALLMCKKNPEILMAKIVIKAVKERVEAVKKKR